MQMNRELQKANKSLQTELESRTGLQSAELGRYPDGHWELTNYFNARVFYLAHGKTGQLSPAFPDWRRRLRILGGIILPTSNNLRIPRGSNRQQGFYLELTIDSD